MDTSSYWRDGETEGWRMHEGERNEEMLDDWGFLDPE